MKTHIRACPGSSRIWRNSQVCSFWLFCDPLLFLFHSAVGCGGRAAPLYYGVPRIAHLGMRYVSRDLENRVFIHWVAWEGWPLILTCACHQVLTTLGPVVHVPGFVASTSVLLEIGCGLIYLTPHPVVTSIAGERSAVMTVFLGGRVPHLLNPLLYGTMCTCANPLPSSPAQQAWSCSKIAHGPLNKHLIFYKPITTVYNS